MMKSNVFVLGRHTLEHSRRSVLAPTVYFQMVWRAGAHASSSRSGREKDRESINGKNVSD